MRKIKYILKAAVILGIVFAFVAPVTAMTEKIQPTTTKLTPYSKLHQMLNLDAGWVEQASGFWVANRGIHYMYAVNENVVWAVGYDGSGSSAPVQEFTRTTNGGDQWVADLIDGAPSGGDTAMIFALDDMTAWVPIHTGNPQGIWKTTDGGNTWAQQTTADFTGGFPNTVHFWDENIGWCMGDPVGGYYEIYTTTDGGDNWVRVPSSNIPAPSSSIEYGVVGYYDVIGDTVWFGTQDANYGGRVFKSIDRGHNWTVSSVIFAPGSYVDIRFKDALNGLAMDKNFEVAALAETSDGGLTWTPITQSGMCYAADFDYVPETPNMYVSTGVNTNDPLWQGASYSLDGGHSWTSWTEMEGIQLFGTSWVAGQIGWAGTFNVDETTGGVYKYSSPPIADFTWTPTNPIPGQTINFDASASYDPNGIITLYEWDWNNDNIYDENHTIPTTTYSWPDEGDYPVKLRVTDNEGGQDTETKTMFVGNRPPSAPIIDGPPHGKIKTKLEYNFTSTDANDDDIAEYIINWGDGTSNETITGPFTSGETVKANHTWAKKGDYVITAKAVDINDAEGPIGSMSITIPRTKAISTPFLNFLQNHPLFSLILKLVLQ
jgi:photosystem II stability/assembly factor-like uncharacterized protein